MLDTALCLLCLTPALELGVQAWVLLVGYSDCCLITFFFVSVFCCCCCCSFSSISFLLYSHNAQFTFLKTCQCSELSNSVCLKYRNLNSLQYNKLESKVISLSSIDFRIGCLGEWQNGDCSYWSIWFESWIMTFPVENTPLGVWESQIRDWE